MTKGKNGPKFKGQVFTGKDGTGAEIEVKDTKGVNKDILIAKLKATHSRYVGVEGKYKNSRLSGKVYGDKESGFFCALFASRPGCVPGYFQDAKIFYTNKIKKYVLLSIFK